MDIILSILSITIIDLALSGDNAAVIGLQLKTCRNPVFIPGSMGKPFS
ncbi:MAG: hypothetical protein ACOY3J_10570 [Bacillota bacterium]